MSWTDSLAPADVAELGAIAEQLGPERFQHYLFIAATILVFGPVRCATRPGIPDDPVWDALILEQDGFLHLNSGAGA